MSISNKDMKYLLADSPEGTEESVIQNVLKLKKQIEQMYHHDIEVEETDRVVTWNDIREATWRDTSITEDMRRMNTQRLLHEVRARIETIAAEHMGYNGALNVTAYQLRDETENMLRRYQDMGALRDFRVDSLQQTQELGSLTPEVNMSVTIVPNATLERINMEIRLTP